MESGPLLGIRVEGVSLLGSDDVRVKIGHHCHC